MLKLMMIAAGALFVTTAPPAAADAGADPTCSDLAFLDIEVHGQHIIRDYVTGGAEEEWPPVSMRDILRENGGAVVHGGPGPGFHFPNGVQPGASFCTGAQSWHALDD